MIVLKWGDGEYPFHLACKQIEELQRVCGDARAPVGFGTIANRVFGRQFFIGDIVHTIRLGLIGGGLEPVRAKQLVEAYVDGQPLAKPSDPSSPLATAQAVLDAAFFGVGLEEKPPGEADAAEPKAASSTSRRSKRTSSKPSSSSLPKSTE